MTSDMAALATEGGLFLGFLLFALSTTSWSDWKVFWYETTSSVSKALRKARSGS